MLNRIALYKEKSESLKRKVKKALYYPMAVLSVAVIVTIILLVKVVPTFKELFKSFGGELPGFTQFVLMISELLQNYGFYILFALIILIYYFIHSYKTKPAFRHVLERLYLNVPLIGKLLQKAIVARFSRTLATTSAAGVPLTDAMDSVGKAAGNIVYQNAIYTMREGLATGQPLHVVMRQTGVFPLLVSQMISIGEESGTLDQMLEKVANIYEEEVDLSVDGLTTLLEPLIMILLGIVVGSLVIAMYLPIFKMGSIV
jgi:type IV pilus assembly protein PilC